MIILAYQYYGEVFCEDCATFEGIRMKDALAIYDIHEQLNDLICDSCLTILKLGTDTTTESSEKPSKIYGHRS